MRYLLILLALPLQAATYYVATTGNNSNTCVQAQSATTPKLYVSQGVACAHTPGDIVMVAAGTYGNEGKIGNGTLCANGCVEPVFINWAGTQAAPITLRGSDPSNPPVLDCGNTPTQLGCDLYIWLDTSAASWWTFQYLRITRGGQGAITTGNGASHIRLYNMEMDHIGNFSTTSTYGISATGGDTTATDWVINACSIHDIGRTNTGFNLDHGIYGHNNTEVITNTLFYNNTKGWHIQMADGVQNWLIANNVFAFPTVGQGAIMWWNTNTNVTVRNNIFFNQSGAAMTSYTPVISNCIFDHNLVYPTQGSGVSQCTSTNQISGNPNFPNTSTAPYNFQPAPPSPAIDSGIAIPQVTADYLGTSRPQPPGGAYDVGAYEYVSATPCVIAPTVLGPWTNTQVINQALTASGTCGTTAWAMTGSWPPALSGCSSGTAATCVVSGTIGLARSTRASPVAILAWQDPTNPAGTTYNVYRAAGTCNSPAPFGQIAGPISALTYTDAGVVATNSCYRVTAVSGGLESTPSNIVDALVPASYTPTVTYGTASNAYAIVVNPAPEITTTVLPGGFVGFSYSQQLAVSGGTTPVSCSLTTGSLPPPLTLSSGCLISGTPISTGTANFTVGATDANGVVTTQALSITVSAPSQTQGIMVSGGSQCGGGCHVQ